MVVVTEQVLKRCSSSEMDRQVETDRPGNTKGNIGSSHIMRPVNLNASRLSSEQAAAEDRGSHFFSGRIFQDNLSPLTLAGR